MNIPDTTTIYVSPGIATWSGSAAVPQVAVLQPLLDRHREAAERARGTSLASRFRATLDGVTAVVIVETRWSPELQALMTLVCRPEEWESLTGEALEAMRWPRDN